jgi:hypothetical protein
MSLSNHQDVQRMYRGLLEDIRVGRLLSEKVVLKIYVGYPKYIHMISQVHEIRIPGGSGGYLGI